MYIPRGGSPFDHRPFPDATPPKGKIHHFSKMTVTFEPIHYAKKDKLIF